MSKRVVVFGLIALLGAGCGQSSDKGDKSKTVSTHKKGRQVVSKSKKVKISEDIKNAWKQASVFVKNKKTGDGKIYNVQLNSDFKISATSLVVKVGAFIPDFHIGKDYISSKSKELNNPALQVTVMDGEKEVYRGWLFSKFPDMHTFEHPEYSLSLAEEMFQDVNLK